MNRSSLITKIMLPEEVRTIIVEQIVKHASPMKTIRYRFLRVGIRKWNVFQAMPGSLQQLKSAVKDAIRNVNKNMLTAVIANSCKRVDACIQEKWSHFENVLYSKYNFNSCTFKIVFFFLFDFILSGIITVWFRHLFLWTPCS